MDFSAFDVSILLSIIAINLTLIGLTSLAETRKVIGVDYGKFLITKATIVGKIKHKHFLVFFTMLNIFATLSLFWIKKYILLLEIVSISLVVLLCLLLIYFMSSILFVNKRVKMQIYISTMSGLYTSKNEKERKHIFFDEALKIPDGSTTLKKVVSDVYKYFDEDSEYIKDSFIEIFGGNSFIYNGSKNKLEKKAMQFPYVYRSVEDSYDIRHEFFQLFKQTKLQSVWCLNIFELLKGRRYNYITYSNIVRILGNVVLYGHDKTLYTHKFLNFITDEYINHFENQDETFHDELDFNEIENMFLELYFNFSILIIKKINDEYGYFAIRECVNRILNMVYKKTFLSEKTKIEVFEKSINRFENNNEVLFSKIMKSVNTNSNNNII